MAVKAVVTKWNYAQKDYLFCGLCQEDTLVEAHLTPLNEQGEAKESSILGNIYVGKVQRIVPNLNAAFVEIAPGFSCYLPLEQVNAPIYVKRNSTKLLVQEDEILVQVNREAIRQKAPAVTTNLNLTGRYLVLTTENKRLGVSGKLEGNTKAQLRALLSPYVDTYGIIVRTNAREAAKADILGELQWLKDRLDTWTKTAKTRTCFSCLHKATPDYLRFLQNTYSASLTEIVTDQEAIYQELKEYCGRYADLREIPLRQYTDESYPLTQLYNLNRQLERALAKTVWLKSGGFLVIEPTEAMTVIDVNTGKSNWGKNPQEHFIRTNREASREIAKQLRLRNLSGIIIIDYIDLESPTEQLHLLEDLREQVAADPIPVLVHDITKLNLVEVTRKKVAKTLMEQI